MITSIPSYFLKFKEREVVWVPFFCPNSRRGGRGAPKRIEARGHWAPDAHSDDMKQIGIRVVK